MPRPCEVLPEYVVPAAGRPPAIATAANTAVSTDTTHAMRPTTPPVRRWSRENLQRGAVDRAQLVAIGGGRRVRQLRALRGRVGARVERRAVHAESGEMRRAGQVGQVLGDRDVGDQLEPA